MKNYSVQTIWSFECPVILQTARITFSKEWSHLFRNFKLRKHDLLVVYVYKINSLSLSSFFTNIRRFTGEICLHQYLSNEFKKNIFSPKLLVASLYSSKSIKGVWYFINTTFNFYWVSIIFAGLRFSEPFSMGFKVSLRKWQTWNWCIADQTGYSLTSRPREEFVSLQFIA